MRLVRIWMRGGVARNEIFVLKCRYYSPKGFFWTIGEHLYIVYYPIISYQKIIFIGLKNGYGKIQLEQWFQWEDSSEKMRPLNNEIIVSYMVLIVQDKILQ